MIDIATDGAQEPGDKDSGFIMIRSERAGDYDAVRRLNQSAFGRPAEGALVDALRPAADPGISLVAIDRDEVVGHIFFSPVSVITEGEPFSAMGLGPMAVDPSRQNQGVGSMLVREGLRRCREMGQDAVVVLGHTWFYPQFGFVPASGKGIRSEYDVPDDVFMVLELEPGTLDGRDALVRYLPAFSGVE